MNSALVAQTDDTAVAAINLQSGRPYNLPRLQQAAHERHGFDARQTLRIAEALYERHLITYPRTDIEFVPGCLFDEYAKMAKDINRAAEQSLCDPTYKGDCWLDGDKFPYEHFAILPKSMTAAAMIFAVLPVEQLSIYRLICEGLVAAFTPPAA